MHGALALAMTLAQAPTPASPTSLAPQATPTAAHPTEFRDPRPRTFDPPHGRYLLPNRAVIVADPPRGYYDPPPGLYPKTTTTSPSPEARAARGIILGPLPTAEASMPAWLAKRRRLRIALGISSGLILATALTPALGAGIEAAQDRDQGPKGSVDGYPPGFFVLVFGTPLAILATIVTGTLLGVHKHRQPRTNHRLQVTPGALNLAF